MATEDDLENAAFDHDEDEAALARLREAEERLRKTPPRCLAGFTSEPATLPGVAFDRHGSDLNKVYKLACRCEGDRFRVLGHPLKNDRGVDIFARPLSLQSADCGQ